MNKLKKSILTNAGLLISGRIIDKISALIIAVLLARFLGSENLGIYYLAISYINIFYTVTNLGIDLFLTRELSIKNSDPGKLYSQGLIFKLIISLFSITLLIIIVTLSPYASLAKTIIIWSSSIIILDSINGLYSALFISKQLVKYEAISLAFEKILILLFVFISLNLNPDLFSIFTIFIIIKMISIGLRYIFQKRNIKISFTPFNKTEFFQMFRKNIVYALTHLFSKIYIQIDILLLSYLSVMTSIGLYQASTRLVLGLMVIPQTLTVNLIPYITKNYKDNFNIVDSINRHTNRILLFIAGFFLIFFYIYSKEILLLLYGNEFQPAALVLKIIAISIPFRFVNYLIEAILTSYNMQRERLKGVFICSIINLILNIILITYFDYLGAGIATLSTSIILSLIYLYYLPQKINFSTEILKVTLIFILILILVKLLLFNSIFIHLSLVLMVYLSLAYLSRLIKFSDLRGFKKDVQ